jgi:hypothetical protein
MLDAHLDRYWLRRRLRAQSATERKVAARHSIDSRRSSRAAQQRDSPFGFDDRAGFEQ